MSVVKNREFRTRPTSEAWPAGVNANTEERRVDEREKEKKERTICVCETERGRNLRSQSGTVARKGRRLHCVKEAQPWPGEAKQTSDTHTLMAKS